MIVKVTNGRLVRDGKLVRDDLWLDQKSGKIVSSQVEFFENRRQPDAIVDIGNRIIAPGYIDMQINGAMGTDFSKDYGGDDTDLREGLKRSNRMLIQSGVTAYCPTITSQKNSLYRGNLDALAPLGSRNADDGAESLGAHVEGPFLSPNKNGIHKPDVLQTPSDGFASFESCYGQEPLKGPKNGGAIRMVTGAPELPNMLGVIEECNRRGILFSIGHSTSGIETAEAAVGCGTRMITHLFNAMQQLHHRDPGIIGLLGSSEPRPYYGIICDSIHIHRSCVKLAYQSHPKGAILVTDAMASIGMPDGVYDWTNGDRIIKEGKHLILEGTEKIAGSTTTLDECVRNLVAWTKATLPEAIDCVTAHPARALGIEDSKGFLNPGCDADLVVLDDEGNVLETWKFGEKVYTA